MCLPRPLFQFELHICAEVWMPQVAWFGTVRTSNALILTDDAQAALSVLARTMAAGRYWTLMGLTATAQRQPLSASKSSLKIMDAGSAKISRRIWQTTISVSIKVNLSCCKVSTQWPGPVQAAAECDRSE